MNLFYTVRLLVRRIILLILLSSIAQIALAQLGNRDNNGKTYGERDIDKTAANTAKPNSPYAPRAVDGRSAKDFEDMLKNNKPETPEQRLARINAENKTKSELWKQVQNRPADKFGFLPLEYSAEIYSELGKCLGGNCQDGRGQLQYPDGKIIDGFFHQGQLGGVAKITTDETHYTYATYKYGKREGAATIYAPEGILNLVYVNGHAFGNADFHLKNGDKKFYHYLNDSINGLCHYIFKGNRGDVYDLYQMNKKITTLRSRIGNTVYPTSDMTNVTWIYDDDLKAQKSIYETQGDFYSGERNSNKRRHGTGIYGWGSGKFYSGDWRKGNMDGTGRMTFADGSYYEGEWNNDKKSGKGIIHYTDGAMYIGDWKNDERDGKGIILTGDGENYYKGNFKNNMFDGTGKMIYRSGYTIITQYNKGSEVSLKFLNDAGAEISRQEFEKTGNVVL